jgi:DNA replication ATP-dependent helicase Dna2
VSFLQVVSALVSCGVPAADIGVIAPYRAQLQLLLQRIAHGGIDVYTVDRYQGRDKDCIVVSLVRSNPDGMVR